MAKKASPTVLSPTEFKDETSSRRRAKRDSIKDYVNDVLTKQVRSDGTPTDLTQAEVIIGTEPSNIPEYQNVSAFRRYHSNAEGTARINAQRQRGHGSSSDEELKFTTQSGDVRKYLF